MVNGIWQMQMIQLKNNWKETKRKQRNKTQQKATRVCLASAVKNMITETCHTELQYEWYNRIEFMTQQQVVISMIKFGENSSCNSTNYMA